MVSPLDRCYWLMSHFYLVGSQYIHWTCIGSGLSCSAETQPDQFTAVGQPRDNPDFNTKNAAEAHAWLEEFVASGRGVNRATSSISLPATSKSLTVV